MYTCSYTGLTYKPPLSVVDILSTPDRRQSKTLFINERGLKSLDTVFSIAICRQWGDKWQSKTLFLTFFDLPFVDSTNVFDGGH